jgi:outer membrane protein OmpA-like peptidoglycan-associated protein
MKKRFVGLALLALAATGSMAQGQATSSSAASASSDAWFRQWELGVFGQYTKIDDKLQMDAVPAIGGRLGTLVYKWIGAEADIQYGPSKETRPPEADIKYSPYRALITLNMPTSEKTRLILGGGYVQSIYKGRSTPNEYEDGIAGLLGLKICGSGKWGFRVDGLADYNPSPNEQELTGTSVNYGGRVGFTYAIKGDCLGTSFFDWQLRISPTTAVVAIGATRQYALTADDDKLRAIAIAKVLGVNCTSSNPGVATVDNTGNVRGVAFGEATINCTGTVKNLQRTASATVSVPAPAWTITASGAQTRNVGQTAAFTCTTRDAGGADLGACTWSSSNNAVATVNATGTATCISGGTATITATKNSFGSTKTATSTLTCVAPPPPPVVMIRLDSTQFDFNRAVVKPAGRELLQTVIDAMKRDPSIRVSIEGHTDWYGSDAYNMRLSTSRANAVATALRRLAGTEVAADRFSAMGYGEQCILVRDGDPDETARKPISAANRAAQQPNRRVAIWQLQPNESGSPTSCRLESQATNRIPFSQSR